MDKQDDFNKIEEFNTEDLTELIDDDIDMHTITETLEIPSKYPEFRRENYERSEYTMNTDFADLVKKRDYKGFHSDIEDEIEKTKKLQKIENIDDEEEKKPSGKKKLKKWVYILLLLVLIGGGLLGYKIYSDKKKAREKEEADKAKIAEINSHYNKIIKVSKDTEIYEKEDDKYKEIGMVYEGDIFELEDTKIDLDTKYFHIKDLDFYIPYEDVEKSEEEELSDRYKSYLPFNTNIVTKDEFTMNVGEDKYITLKKSMKFPVIINNYNNRYYVEYNNRLVSISKDDVENTESSNNTDKKNQSKITTLAYHRIYDTTDKCTDPYVCVKKATFDKHMKYLKDKGYLTLTMDEMYMYMKGKLQVEKGVVITIDDGLLFKSADEILDKYGLNATMFVATGAFKDHEQFKGLKAIENQSHTHNMHKNYKCTPNTPSSQGGAILCASKQAIVDDLKKSCELLGVEPIAMAFPFYDFNDNAIAAVKEAGFKMAFIGRAGVMGRATPKSTNLYKIPRMTVWEETIMSYSAWKSYL